jgi:hypothetical protein
MVPNAFMEGELCDGHDFYIWGVVDAVNELVAINEGVWCLLLPSGMGGLREAHG